MFESQSGPGVGCGYRRIADTTCSATTLRRRDERIALGPGRAAAPAGAGRRWPAIRLGAGAAAVDSCTTKTPSGGKVAGPSPVYRRKQGLKRSLAVEAGASRWPPCLPRQPARRRVAGRDPGRRRPDRAATRPALAHRTRLRLKAVSAGAGRSAMAGQIATRGCQPESRLLPLSDERPIPGVISRASCAGAPNGAGPWSSLAGADECRRRLWSARPPRLDPMTAWTAAPPPMTTYRRRLLAIRRWIGGG
jgi:hypothetical protein